MLIHHEPRSPSMPVSIYSLPWELIASVTASLDSRESSRFARSCHFLYETVSHVLYRRVKDDINVLAWAAEEGVVGTMERLLAAGADANRRLTPDSDDIPKPLPPVFGPHGGSRHALQDYNMQLMLLERQSMRRHAIQCTHGATGPGRHTMLHLASKYGHKDVVEILLDHHADIDTLAQGLCRCNDELRRVAHRTGASFSGTSWTPLHLAICRGHLSTMKLLISRGAAFVVGEEAATIAPAFTTGPFMTALHCTSAKGHLQAIGAVLTHYLPDINVVDAFGLTPFAWAFYNARSDAMQFLLGHGADVNKADSTHGSLLIQACIQHQTSEAMWLLRWGADARRKETRRGRAALHYVCEPNIRDPFTPANADSTWFDRWALAKALLEAGADANAADYDAQTPLVAAAKAGYPRMISLLLDHGANINDHGSCGETALIAACRPDGLATLENMSHIFELLLDRGASPLEMTSLGKTALDVLSCAAFDPRLGRAALSQVRKGMVEKLLQHGASPNALTDGVHSPLFQYFMRDHLDCCKTLVQHGATTPSAAELRKMIAHAIKADHADMLRFVLEFEGAKRLTATPSRVFNAIKTSATNAAEILLDNGCPHTHKSKAGWGCLHYACSKGHIGTGVHRKLLAAGADPNATTSEGMTPLKLAIKSREDLGIVQLLLEAGADPDLAGPDGTSPLMLASMFNHIEILEALLKRSKEAPADRWQHLLKLKSRSEGTEQMPYYADAFATVKPGESSTLMFYDGKPQSAARTTLYTGRPANR